MGHLRRTRHGRGRRAPGRRAAGARRMVTALAVRRAPRPRPAARPLGGARLPRHSHEGFVIAVVTGGIEEVGLSGGAVRAGHGGVIMLNPEVPHSARAGQREGWSYDTLYPSARLVAEVARETTGLRGTPGFAETVADVPRTGRLITEVHRAAEAGDVLTADSLLRVVLARLLRRYGGPLPVRAPRSRPRRPRRPCQAGLRRHEGRPGVGVAVGLSGFAFGVTSACAGIGLLQTCALSLLVFTGAS